ncbi:hypothetical protein P9D43_27165 [Neobacillus niacini]|uniref:hypothetical protein n=1 Tax=Neobacillus niacini TaxID=86668 RepID=UPI000AF6F74F|nr:hypothetical protein [Neobacillus niacini]MEC1525688.1 hypothetical protein [Neobacillus niacini]
MPKKGPFDLKQRQIQKIYKDNLRKSENSFFLIFIACFFIGALLLALASFIYNLVH